MHWNENKLISIVTVNVCALPATNKMRVGHISAQQRISLRISVMSCLMYQFQCRPLILSLVIRLWVQKKKIICYNFYSYHGTCQLNPYVQSKGSESGRLPREEAFSAGNKKETGSSQYGSWFVDIKIRLWREKGLPVRMFGLYGRRGLIFIKEILIPSLFSMNWILCL